MRIISGKLKGSVLYGPNSKKIRPLKDMVRESIFNFLLHSNKISLQLGQSNILDLYSGTGSFGLECLSREANKVVFSYMADDDSDKGGTMRLGAYKAQLKKGS